MKIRYDEDKGARAPERVGRVYAASALRKGE